MQTVSIEYNLGLLGLNEAERKQFDLEEPTSIGHLDVLTFAKDNHDMATYTFGVHHAMRRLDKDTLSEVLEAELVAIAKEAKEWVAANG